MSHKHALGYIRQRIEAEGYLLLSTEYENNKVKLHTRCPRGHNYYVSWKDFSSRGTRCTDPVCRNGKVLYISTEYIKRQIEAEGYLLFSEYKNYTAKLHTKCPNGHDYYVSWDKFKTGTRCSEKICKKENPKRLSLEHIKRHLEEQGYRFLSKKYSNHILRLNVICPNGHVYDVNYSNFKRGTRCPKCSRCQSKVEQEISLLFAGFTLKERDREQIKPKELDLYFSDHRVAVEYCGLYWHSDGAPNPRPSSYHRDKMDECQAQGIHLLTIFEDEWLNHKDICISRINNALGICPNRIYARKCEAKQIDKKEAKEFLNRTHLQGYGRCKLAFGLYYKGILVQVMTWGSPARAHTAKGKKVLEMKRFAGEIDTVIIGGAGKLFKFGLAYAKQEGYDSLKSYCDLRWGTGNLYAKLGFTKTYETRYTPHYTDGVNRYRNQVLAQNKNKTGKTEAEVAMEKGLWKIYDCGHSTWEYEVN